MAGHRKAKKTYLVAQALFFQGGAVFNKQTFRGQETGKIFSQKLRNWPIVADQPARRQAQAPTQGLIQLARPTQTKPTARKCLERQLRGYLMLLAQIPQRH